VILVRMSRCPGCQWGLDEQILVGGLRFVTHLEVCHKALDDDALRCDDGI
jgi:hypothetical protein